MKGIVPGQRHIVHADQNVTLRELALGKTVRKDVLDGHASTFVDA